MSTTMDDLIDGLIVDNVSAPELEHESDLQPEPMPEVEAVAARLYYAPSDRGFYASDVHTAIPEDAVEITPEYKQALFDGQSTGKTIMPPDDGHDLPWLADPLAPTPEEIASRRVFAIRGRLAAIDAESIRPLRAIADGSATEADRAKLAALEEEAGALREELEVAE